jgi:hypothetical protein
MRGPHEITEIEAFGRSLRPNGKKAASVVEAGIVHVSL